jgi:LmbE family N-acetylglucosaminyl deacetylase
MSNRILGVFAHPDDESFGPGGTLTKYARNNNIVKIVTLTRGEAGTLGISKHLSQQELATLREKELRSAAKWLKTSDVSVYQFPDNKLSTISEKVLIETIKKEIVSFLPNIVITFHPNGITGHKDHIKTSKCTTSAIMSLKNQPKLFYYGIPDLQLSFESQRKLYVMKDSEITHCIDIKNYYEYKN